MRRLPYLFTFACLCLVAGAFISCNPQRTPETEPAPTPTTPVETNINVILYRGDAQRTGVYDLPAILHQPEVKWQAQAGLTLLTSPLVVDGLLYTISLSGTLYALDVNTGAQVWSVQGIGQHENAGAIAGDMLISAGVRKAVIARDRRTGNELWTFETNYLVQAAPLIVNDRVYIATDREIYALDLQSGELIWNVQTGTKEAYVGAPAYHAGVIYTSSGRALLALDSQNGEELWRVERDEQFLSPAVANQTVYVGNSNRVFYAFDSLTGEERWKFEGQGQFWSAPAVTDQIVYVGNSNQLYALETDNGQELWSFETGGEPVSEPLFSDGVLYFSDSNHEVPRGPRHLYAVDAATGAELWVFDSISTFLPAPALGDGVIYVTSTSEVIALE